MRSAYKIHDPEGTYFVTSTVIEWIPVFTAKLYFDILVASIRYCQTNYGLAVFAWVILDNHFHLLCRAPELSKVMQSLKRHTAKMIIQRLEEDRKKWVLDLLTYYKLRHKKESEHQLWQEGVHPQQIVSVEMLNQKIEYIHFNPVKRGYVAEPEHWVYSSAGDFVLGRKGLIEIQALPV
jgi:REP element-mobilizing transposase RayT